MTEPLIALAIGIAFLLVSWAFLRPEKGLIARWQQSQQKTARVLREDALKHMHRCFRAAHCATLESIAGALSISVDQAADVVVDLEQRWLLERDGSQLALTTAGEEAALHIIRAHRLWERYLSDRTGYDQMVWHAQAERHEHKLTPEAADLLAAELGYPSFDPHGDPIPTADGRLGQHGGIPIHQFLGGDRVRITHLEDEPEAVYAHIVAEDLHPGMVVQVAEVSAARVVFWSNGHEHIVAPIVAANITAVPVIKEEQLLHGERLDSLALGETAEVIRLSPACRGSERRRFLDLGLVPGTAVSTAFVSPSGEPTAYQIRGALIALRSDQARKIHVKRLPE